MANLSNINNKFLVTTGGNVLIGKTAANNATVGTQIMSTGDINPTVSGDTVARFNRLGTDGEIIRFQHDTSTDGAINSLSGRIAIGSSNTGIFFDSIRQVITPWDITDNDNEFNNISLGRDIVRFKDVYLSGRVMAGTGTTAAASLNAYTQTVSTNLYSALRIVENSAASSYWDIGATGGGQPDLNFYVNGVTTPKLTIQANGNVGIGTVSPDYNLEIEATDAKAFVHYVSASRGGIAAYSSQRIAFTTTGSSDDLVFGYNNGATATSANFVEHMRIDNGTGNVGIGITPNVNSNVVNVIQLGKGMTLLGNVNDDRATMAANLYLDTGTAFRYVMDGYAGRFSIEDGNMVWGTASSGTAGSVATVDTKMTLLNNGNVGIGNTAPRDKLTVFTAGAAEEEIALRLVNPIGFTNGGSGASIIFAQDRNTGENLPMAKIRSSQSIAGTSSYGDLIFSTLSSTMQDRMIIRSGGGVECYDYLKAAYIFSKNGSFSTTAGTWTNVIELQQSEFENRTVLCSVYTNGTHSYASATVNCAWNGGSFVLTLGNKIVNGSTDLRISGGYLQFYTPWTSTTNFYRLTVN